jgi:hypothetical protein
MVDQNIGRPLRKILSYRCSTPFVFEVRWGSIQTFGEICIQTMLNEVGSAPRRDDTPAWTRRGSARARRVSPSCLDVRVPYDVRASRGPPSHLAVRNPSQGPRGSRVRHAPPSLCAAPCLGRSTRRSRAHPHGGPDPVPPTRRCIGPHLVRPYKIPGPLPARARLSSSPCARPTPPLERHHQAPPSAPFRRR